MTAPATKHIIHKLSLEINVEGEQQGRNIQADSMEFVKQNMLSMLEELLDDLDEGDLVRIDHLEVHLDQIDPQRIRQDLLLQIKRKLPQKIREAIREEAIIQTARSPLDTLEFFLNTGILPWWDNSTNLPALESSILQTLDQSPDFKARLRNILTDSNPDRIILQLSDDFLKAIFEVLELPDAFWSELQYAQTLLMDNFSPRKVRSYFMRSVLQSLNTPSPTALPLQKILKTAFQQLQAEAPMLFQKALKQLPALQVASQRITESMLREWPPSTPKKDSGKAVSAAVGPEHKQSSKVETEPESIYIENAGLVLLHPFIVYLFRELEYTKKDRFVDPFQQQQAALVLQYLLAPEEQFPEHDLMLNKLLCGIAPEQPIESKLILNEAIRTQTEQLLQSTIKHWPALKNTSIDGLRHNFLLREGKLSRKEDGEWKLFVEYQTHDILLAKLNWNYSLVKLPWMNNILWVEWA